MELAAAAKMPPLYHTLPGEVFQLKKSEAMDWLSKRPELISYIFNRANKAKEIVYNPETGKWQGVDYNGE